MQGRERIQALLAHTEPDRIGVWDAYWEDTILNWEQQGLPRGVSPTTYFNMDFENLYLDASLRLPERLLEDHPEYTLREDKHGFVAKQWKNRSGALGYLKHTVQTEQDWADLRRRLDIDFGGTARIGPASYFTPFTPFPTWEQLQVQFAAMRQRGKYVLLHVYGPIEATWRKHGFEETLSDLALNPNWMRDMFEAHIDLIIGTLQTAQTYGIIPDGLFVVDDRGIGTGPMFSPRAHRTLVMPCDQRLADYLRSAGITFFMHSDGDIRRFLPDMIGAGLQVLQPMEAKAGMDVRLLKQEYGRDLSFMGNIDATQMSGDLETLEAEIRDKITAARVDGGYIYHSDHSVPPSVDWARYQWIVERVIHYGTYA
jgi:uroporphyrinogen decarboxylase